MQTTDTYIFSPPVRPASYCVAKLQTSDPSSIYQTLIDTASRRLKAQVGNLGCNPNLTLIDHIDIASRSVLGCIGPIKPKSFQPRFSLSFSGLFLCSRVSSGQHAFLSPPLEQFVSLVCVCQDRPGGHHGDLRLLETPCENPHV